jgi:hypothetical protein
MFCIAAFIVFAVLGIFSAAFRPLAKKAWHCVLRRVTLRPCDIAFGDEIKAKLIGRLIFHHPRTARFLSRWIDWLSFAFVALSIWSVIYVLIAGLNLWVYDTCDPRSAESCSLSGEACGVEQDGLDIFTALQTGRIHEWVLQPATQFGQTLMRIPDRLRIWNAAEFVSSTATYRKAFDPQKSTVLEIVDPSCTFCAKLTKHMEQADIASNANVTYLLYPIPKPGGGTKFPRSMLMAQYVEATKLVPLNKGSEPGDWQLLRALFVSEEQEKFVMVLTASEAEQELQSLLLRIGYSRADVKHIEKIANSREVKNALDTQKKIVEEKVRTIKIPTLLIAGRRFDRVISAERLRLLLP